MSDLFFDAAKDGDIDTITTMLQNSIREIDETNEYGQTVLIIATENGHSVLVNILLRDYKATVNVIDNDGFCINPGCLLWSY